MADVAVPAIATVGPGAGDTVLGVQGGAVKRLAVGTGSGLALEADLSSATDLAKGSSMVGFLQSGAGAVGRTSQEKLSDIAVRADFDSDASFNAGKTGKLSVDSSGRLRSTSFVAGNEELSGASARDAVVVGRNVTGLTDCHAFADRTVIDSVIDPGTYGAFDATTKLLGQHTQEHVFAFQDRIEYAGSGVLQDLAGIWSAPKFTGSGTIDSRSGVVVNDVAKTGLGTITSNIGILVRNQASGVTNVGLNVQQSEGYAIYAGGGAKSLHSGSLGVGGEPAAGAKLTVNGGSGVNDVAVLVTKTDGYSLYSNNNSKMYHLGNVAFGSRQNTDGVALVVSGSATGPKAYMHASSTTAFFGQTGGDYPIQFFANGASRFELAASAQLYSIRPGLDNTQPLGDATKRWSVIYASTGAINTSDEREKQDIESLDAAEMRVASALKGLIRKFRFRDAVANKGDNARIHIGVIAQDVIYAFHAEGLDPMRYGVICYDEWPAAPDVVDNDGNVTEPARDSGNRYGVRYEELIAFIIAAL